jgi:hypothetical protein
MTEWIKFSERKPEDGGEIVCSFEKGYITANYDANLELGFVYFKYRINFYIEDWVPVEDFKGWSNG